jgi:phosphoglycolate phosphatase
MSADNVFDLVIFDYDGTLGDTRSAIAHCLERALAKHSMPILAVERVMPAVGKGLSLQETCILLDASLRNHSALLDEIVGTYRTLYREEGEPLIEMFAGAREAIEKIHASGAKCIVVSNKGIDAVIRSLERYEMASFVDLILADQPGLPHKPDPALLTGHILPKFPQIARQRMLMVGDTEIDIEFAKMTGIACCWVAYGFGDRERCLALAPDYLIESVAEVAAIVRGRGGHG